MLAEHLRGSASHILEQSSLICGNDTGYEYAFAQQVLGYGQPGDVLLAITTSGNSAMWYACLVARALGNGYQVYRRGWGNGSTSQPHWPQTRNCPCAELQQAIYHYICLKSKGGSSRVKFCCGAPRKV